MTETPGQRTLRVGDHVLMTPRGEALARERRVGAGLPGIVEEVRGRQVYVVRKGAITGIALWWPMSAWEVCDD